MISTVSPPPTDFQLLTRAAQKRRLDAAQFARDGNRNAAVRAARESESLHRHAAAAAKVGVKAPGNRAAMVTFARAVLAGGGS